MTAYTDAFTGTENLASHDGGGGLGTWTVTTVGARVPLVGGGVATLTNSVEVDPDISPILMETGASPVSSGGAFLAYGTLCYTVSEHEGFPNFSGETDIVTLSGDDGAGANYIVVLHPDGAHAAPTFTVTAMVIAGGVTVGPTTSASLTGLTYGVANGATFTMGVDVSGTVFRVGFKVGGAWTYVLTLDITGCTFPPLHYGVQLPTLDWERGDSTAVLTVDDFTVEATAPPADPTKSTVALGASTIYVAQTTTITLTAKDSSGTTITAGGETVVLGAGCVAYTVGATTDVGDGTYTATATGAAAGACAVTATIGGVTVTTTLPTITVLARPTPTPRGNGGGSGGPCGGAMTYGLPASVTKWAEARQYALRFGLGASGRWQRFAVVHGATVNVTTSDVNYFALYDLLVKGQPVKQRTDTF